jgi:hypothetical protein
MIHALKVAVIVIGATILLSGCAVRSRTEIDVPGVRVESGAGYEPAHPHGYRHCPPGHAKKGWC